MRSRLPPLAIIVSSIFVRSALVVIPFIVAGCASQPIAPHTVASAVVVPETTVEKPAAVPAPKPVKRVTNRPANTKGDVLILEYHHVLPEETRWGRSQKKFRQDLERLYKAGFRPITLSEYLSGNFKIPPGSSPVVFTFDDGHINQFRMLDDGTIDPNCAVGIWKKFAETRPDFPVKATWFVLPPVPFTQKKFAKQKLALLNKWGSEIGIHTMTHRSFKKLPDEAVKKEIAGSLDWIAKYGIKARTMAMPYGEYPQNKALLKSFTYNGKKYSLDGAVRVGAVPSKAPGSKEVKRYGLPRIQGVDLEGGLNWWLAELKDKPKRLYVAP